MPKIRNFTVLPALPESLKKLEVIAKNMYWSWEPDADAPGWGFPYVVDAVHWIGYALYNFPSHIRWDRLGISI